MKIIQTLFCGIILATLAIPGWFTMMKPFTGQQARTSPAEQRRLVQFKQASLAWPNIKSTVQTFGQAFDDQLFARTKILQAVNGVLVEQGRHSTSDTILFGEDGYRFFMRQQDVKVFAQIPCAVPGGLDEEKRQLTVDNYIAFARRMKAKGIETRLILIPTKSSIYPEKLPKYMHPYCVDSAPPAVNTVEQIQAAGFAARYDLEWFIKQNPSQAFYPKSFHWLTSGAHNYAQFLYNENLESMPKISPLDYETKIQHTQIPADISRHLGIKRKTEFMDATTYVWPALTSTKRIAFKEIHDRSKLLGTVDQSVFFYARTHGNVNQKLLMVGDSFSRQIFTYWASTASEAIFLSDSLVAYAPGIIDDTVAKFGANIVVFVVEESRFAPIATENYPYPFATKLLPPE